MATRLDQLSGLNLPVLPIHGITGAVLGGLGANLTPEAWYAYPLAPGPGYTVSKRPNGIVVGGRSAPTYKRHSASGNTWMQQAKSWHSTLNGGNYPLNTVMDFRPDHNYPDFITFSGMRGPKVNDAWWHMIYQQVTGTTQVFDLYGNRVIDPGHDTQFSVNSGFLEFWHRMPGGITPLLSSMYPTEYAMLIEGAPYSIVFVKLEIWWWNADPGWPTSFYGSHP